jgi:hypothetical protein
MHRNDTAEHVITEAVLKRWDSSGNRKINLVFTDLVLSFEIIKKKKKIKKINQLCYV